VLTFFFQLRACDEVKDAEDDRLYRPERAIPRGLVSLRLIVWLAMAAVPVVTAAAAAHDVHPALAAGAGVGMDGIDGRRILRSGVVETATLHLPRLSHVDHAADRPVRDLMRVVDRIWKSTGWSLAVSRLELFQWLRARDRPQDLCSRK
jgi:hypothetical protein